MRGLEPPRREAPDPKSGVSANFTTSAQKHLATQAKQTTSAKRQSKSAAKTAQKWYAHQDSNLRPTA